MSEMAIPLLCSWVDDDGEECPRPAVWRVSSEVGPLEMCDEHLTKHVALSEHPEGELRR